MSSGFIQTGFAWGNDFVTLGNSLPHEFFHLHCATHDEPEWTFVRCYVEQVAQPIKSGMFTELKTKCVGPVTIRRAYDGRHVEDLAAWVTAKLVETYHGSFQDGVKNLIACRLLDGGQVDTINL
jgi:hypothetical protein